MTDKELSEIKARADAATPGPWRVDAVDNESGQTLYCAEVFIEPGVSAVWRMNPNASFIAHARTDVPELVAEVKRLRSELARARKLL